MKYQRVKVVVLQDDYMLLLIIENGEQRRFDMKPYLGEGVFKELMQPEMFCMARVGFDTVTWANNTIRPGNFVRRKLLITKESPNN